MLGFFKDVFFFLRGSEVFSHLQTGTRSLLIVCRSHCFLPGSLFFLTFFFFFFLSYALLSRRLLSPWLPCYCWDHTSAPLNKVICCFARDVVRWGNMRSRIFFATRVTCQLLRRYAYMFFDSGAEGRGFFCEGFNSCRRRIYVKYVRWHCCHIYLIQ